MGSTYALDLHSGGVVLSVLASEARGFKRAVEANPPDVGGDDVRVTRRVRVAKKRKWNIPAPRRFSRRWSAATVEEAGEFDGSHIVPCGLRGGLAVAVAALASSLSGTIAAAQQIAVNVEGQPAQEASPDEEQPDDAYARQIVPFHTSEGLPRNRSSSIRANAISSLVQPNDRAIRYGIGVGRIGFQWSGVEQVSQKQEWPDWRAPPEMVGRQPYLPRFMAGGPGNPLGARALYLGHSVFRIHGTNQPETIGHAVSSGCFRLDNADVIDLYDRVQVGAKVLVRQSAHVS